MSFWKHIAKTQRPSKSAILLACLRRWPRRRLCTDLSPLATTGGLHLQRPPGSPPPRLELARRLLKIRPPLQAPLERLLGPSVGILVEMLFEKGLKTRSKRGPKGDSKEDPAKNMENVSSIHYLLRFSHIERSKKHSFLNQFWGPYLEKRIGPEKNTSKTHLWKLTWPPGGTQCDFWVPNGPP